jgi:hypothetical protein
LFFLVFLVVLFCVEWIVVFSFVCFGQKL